MKTKNLLKILIPTASTLAIVGTTLTACETGGGVVHKAPKILGYSTVIKTVRYKYQLMIDNVVVPATWSVKGDTDAKFVDAENGILEIGLISNNFTIVGKAANGTTAEKTLKVSNYNNGILMTGDHFLDLTEGVNCNYKACVAYPGVTPETQDPDIEWIWEPGLLWDENTAPTAETQEDGSFTITVTKSTTPGYGTLTAKSKSFPSNSESWTISVGITEYATWDEEAIKVLFPEEGDYTVDTENSILKLNKFITEQLVLENPEILLLYDLDWFVIPAKITWDGTPLSVELNSSVFQDNTLISCVYLQDGVKFTGSYQFQGSSLHTIRLPNDLNEIPDTCFKGCNNLKYVKIPDSVTNINYSAFEESAIQYVDIDQAKSSLSSIGTNAFMSCPWLSSITIPNNVQNIGSYAFRNCASLVECKMPASGNININGYAFDGCRNLRSIDLTACVNTDFDSTFDHCFSLSELHLPSKFAPSDDSSFTWGCTRLSTLNYPGTHTQWLGLWDYDSMGKREAITVWKKFSSLPLNAVVKCWENDQWVSYPLFNN